MLLRLEPTVDKLTNGSDGDGFAVNFPVKFGQGLPDGSRWKFALTDLLKLLGDFECFLPIGGLGRLPALPSVGVAKACEPEFASWFSSQAGHAGNISGNFRESPLTFTNILGVEDASF